MTMYYVQCLEEFITRISTFLRDRTVSEKANDVTIIITLIAHLTGYKK